MMGVTQELAQFAFRLRYEDLPKNVIERTKISLLDQLGVQLACSSSLPWSKQIYKTVKELGGKPESTIVYYGDKTTAENAAFVNSAFNHGHELDDTHFPIPTHPGSVIIPASLAMGEKEKVSGKVLILAIVLGHEMMLRVGLGVARSLLWRGHHTPPAIGPFGAAVAVGKILQFDENQMTNALGVAGSFSGGLLEYTRTGSSVKRIHSAIPAQAGIRAALLVRNGITGPDSVLEGEKGFCKVFSDKYCLERITENLGKTYCIMDVSIKRFDCCHFIHSPIEATQYLLKEHDIKPNDIHKVIVRTSEQGKVHCGVIVEPRDVLGAQFSFAYSLAQTVFRGGNRFKDYREEDLKAPDLIEFARRVEVEVDEEFEKLYPEVFGGEVEISLKNGKKYSKRIPYQKGHPKNPLSMDDIKNKFRGLANLVLPHDQTEKIISLLEGLEQINDVSQILPYLVKK